MANKSYSMKKNKAFFNLLEKRVRIYSDEELDDSYLIPKGVNEYIILDEDELKKKVVEPAYMDTGECFSMMIFSQKARMLNPNKSFNQTEFFEEVLKFLNKGYISISKSAWNAMKFYILFSKEQYEYWTQEEIEKYYEKLAELAEE